MPDSVDRLISSWRETDPDLDVSSVSIFTRMRRIRVVAEQRMGNTLAPFDLTLTDLSTLSILYRAEPTGLRMAALAEQLTLSKGSLTSRIQRLHAQRLIEIGHPIADRRGRTVRITELGGERFRAALPHHLATQQQMLGPLDTAERDQLAQLLAKLLTGLERTATSSSPTPNGGAGDAESTPP